MRARLFLFALILVALSCASDEPLHFRFDDDTTDAERHAATDATKRWNPHLLDDHQLVIDPSGAWRITFTEALPDGVNGRTCGRDDALEDNCEFAHWIRIRRGLSPERSLELLMHEQGHALRLTHVGGEGWGDQHSVMTSFSPTATPTGVDLAECIRAGACPSVTIRTLPTE